MSGRKILQERHKTEMGSKVEEMHAFIDTTGKHVLDVTCANKSIWFQKDCRVALYCDKRKTIETVVFANGTRHQDCVIEPDVVCDFTALPFKDNSFELVVIDPPHAQDISADSWTCKRYGCLVAGWEEMIHAGVRECLRVLKPWGTLIFKWSDVHIPTQRVIDAIGEMPLFGHRSGKKMNTHWLCFMKMGTE